MKSQCITHSIHIFYHCVLGVAYDSYTGQVYWSVEGGQGKLYMSGSTLSEDGHVLFSDFRRNPFSLEFDWVARRLFWVEDGVTVSVTFGIYTTY